jgi:hypothetical protein
VLEAYGKEYVLKLAKEPAFLKSETPKIFLEAKEWLSKKTK